MRRICLFLSSALLVAACDSQITLEEFRRSAPPLEISAEVVSPSPIRDTLRVRITGLNSPDGLGPPSGWLDGARVPSVWTQVDAQTVELAVYVSEIEGPHQLRVRAIDVFSEIVGADTFAVAREAEATLRPSIERTYWQRLVTGTSAYESNVRDVFADPRGSLWVQLSGYRNPFWSSSDGARFVQRRNGFERLMAVEGDTAWIEYHTAGSGGSTYLARVDLATGDDVEAYQVFYNGTLWAGASHQGAFYGIDSGRQHLMHVRDGIVGAIEEGPYAYGAGPARLLDYHISPDGVHWLATAGQGVQRNTGTGWAPTAGLASGEALMVREGPGGSVWSMALAGTTCVVAEWEGARWAERATVPRDGNSFCGTFGVGATGGVWRATTDGQITRSKGGVIDRRYEGDRASSILVLGGTVWVGTGYGLREIRDYETAGA